MRRFHFPWDLRCAVRAQQQLACLRERNTSGLFFVVAAYRTWKPEHEARIKAEVALNAEADMKRTIWATILQYNPLQDQGNDASGLHFECRCANHGRKPCEISRACILLSGTDFKDGFRFEQPLPLASVRMVGIGEQFVGSGAFTIRGLKLSQLSRCEITIHLIDSLGTEYLNTDTKIVWRPEFDRMQSG